MVGRTQNTSNNIKHIISLWMAQSHQWKSSLFWGWVFFPHFLMRRHWSNQAVLNWWSQLLCSVYLSDCNFKSPQSELQHTQCIHCAMIKHRNNAEIVQGIQKHSTVLLLQISAQLSSWYWEGAYTSPTREIVYLWAAAPAWQHENN